MFNPVQPGLVVIRSEPIACVIVRLVKKTEERAAFSRHSCSDSAITRNGCYFSGTNTLGPDKAVTCVFPNKELGRGSELLGQANYIIGSTFDFFWRYGCR